MLKEFLAKLRQAYDQKFFYGWGANGERVYDGMVFKGETYAKAVDWIKKIETTLTNTERAIKLYTKRVKEGYGDVIRAVDCSGLVVWAWREIGLFTENDDRSADGFKSRCTKISKSQVLPGDMCFRTYTASSEKVINGKKRDGQAYHIGVIIDFNKNFIESKGRDDGVVIRNLANVGSYWNWYGRPKELKEEIEAQMKIVEETPTTTPTKPTNVVISTVYPVVINRYVEVTGAAVNVRDKADTSGKVLCIARRNNTLGYIDKAKSGWFHVIINGVEGYISNKYSRLIAAKTVQVVGGKVNVREGDSKTTESVGIASKGEVFPLVRVAPTGWYNIVYDGKSAYISNLADLTSVIDNLKKAPIGQ